jgi:hypothetical protein
MLTAKAKSVIYHLNAAKSGMEKAEVHLMQARVGLPVKDTDSRAEVGGSEQALKLFNQAVEEAIIAVTNNNQSPDDEGRDDA